MNLVKNTANASDEVVSVTELTHAIKGLLEEGIGQVLVRGELSNFKPAASGHRYFTLKDADAAIACVMWRSRTLDLHPRDGMQVVVGGRLSVYPPRGNYQLDCVFMREEGLGNLHEAFERLKRTLAERGWFDPATKADLPRFPKTVGIITSPTGAALHDMLTTIARRYPLLEVVFRPALVQGDGSADDIAAAIREMDDAGVDVIIVGRGGGSIEDLWSFNTETVATAIHDARTPVISAVGHETDVTIADFVADRRAATPTAAAELVTPITAADLLDRLEGVRDRMIDAMDQNVGHLLESAIAFTDGTAARRIRERILLRAQRVDDLSARSARGIAHAVRHLRNDLEHLEIRLGTLHPHRPLKLGYAIVEVDGKPLTASRNLQPGDTATLLRYRQQVAVTVDSTTDTPPLDDDHG